MDTPECTLCGICAEHCPTGALSRVETSSSVVLRFLHASCVACGHCEATCPEKALRLRRMLSFPALLSPPVGLKQGALALCEACGGPVGPQILYDKLRRSLEQPEEPVQAFYLGKYCYGCRTKSLIKRLEQPQPARSPAAT